MPKLTLSDVGNFNSTALSVLTANNDAIEAALENTLSRDGTSPNQMTADFDMNHNDILNVASVETESLIVNGETLDLSLIQDAVDAAEEVMTAASSVQSIRNTVVDTISDYHPLVAVEFIAVAGYSEVGDCGRSFIYQHSVSEPTHPGKFQITLAGGATAWYELAEDEVIPEMFGAVPFSTTATDATTPPTTDLSTMTDSTTALANWAEYINETTARGFLPSLYRSTATIAFTKPGLSIEGINARTSGIFFDGCPGITLDLAFGVTLKYTLQSTLFADLVPVAGVRAVVTRDTVNNGIYTKVGGTGTGSWTFTSVLPAAQGTRYAFRRFSMLTNSDRALGYTGLGINCMYSPGGADSFRIIEEMYLGGQRMFETQNQIAIMTAETAANRKQAWAKPIDLLESDNTTLRDIRVHGPIFDWNASYAGTDISYGVYAQGCTALECVRVKTLFPTYGFRTGGASEGTLYQDCVAGACRGGYLYEGFEDASNYHKLIRSHASAHEFCVSFNMDGATPGASQFNIIHGCLFFMFPGSAYGNFSHMLLQLNNTTISDNTLYIAPGDDATVAANIVDEGIEIEGTFNKIDGNTFAGLDLCITVVTGSVSTKITNNVTQGSDAAASPPLVDNGTDTVCMFNSGDAKAELWPANFYDGEKKLDFWSHQPVEIYGGAKGAKYQKANFPNITGTPVNYLEFVPSATGSPVFMRAAGTDTNISLRLIPKGAGRVRFGTRTASADVAVTGYIEIEDSGGTVRRLAVVG